MPTKITVVIAAYNAQKYLAETLESVIQQTFPHWEMVLVDDGSTDGTLELIKDFAGRDSRIRWIHQENAGASTARNQGFLHSDRQVPYVLFLDADDLLEPDALEVLYKTLIANPKAIGVHAAARIIDSTSALVPNGELLDYLRNRRIVDGIGLAECPQDTPTSFRSMVHSNYVITPGTALLRRDAVAATGLFDTSLLNAEDWDLFLRLTLQGDMICLQRFVLRYRRHPGNKSRKHWRMIRTYHAIGKKYAQSDLLTPEQRQAFRIGAFYDGFDKFGVAWKSVRKRDFTEASHQMFRAVRAFARYAGNRFALPLPAGRRRAAVKSNAPIASKIK